jgi:hypothetical protein
MIFTRPYRRPVFDFEGCAKAFPIFCAPTCHKGDSTSSAPTSNVQASQNAVAVGGNSNVVTYTAAGGLTVTGAPTGKHGPSDNGGVQNITYSPTVTDGGAVTAALDQIAKLTDSTLGELSDLAKGNAQNADVQNKQLSYTAVIGLMVLGGLWVMFRRKKI